MEAKKVWVNTQESSRWQFDKNYRGNEFISIFDGQAAIQIPSFYVISPKMKGEI